MRIRIAALLVPIVLTGCANYKVVTGFANDTTTMTGAVKTEFAQLDTLCVDQSTLVLVVNNVADDRPLERCEQHRKTRARFALLTVDVLDGYAKTLLALTDDGTFDVSPDVNALGGKIQALKTSDGAALVTPAEVVALTRLTDLITRIVTTVKRDEAVRKMVEASPDLATSGRLLRSFFVRPEAVAPARASPSVYAEIVGITGEEAESTRRILASRPMREAEPIRTVELLRAERKVTERLQRRDVTKPDSVPTQIVAAIDAWLAAVDRFSDDALKPDPKELLQNLKVLRAKVTAARDAIDNR